MNHFKKVLMLVTTISFLVNVPTIPYAQAGKDDQQNIKQTQKVKPSQSAQRNFKLNKTSAFLYGLLLTAGVLPQVGVPNQAPVFNYSPASGVEPRFSVTAPNSLVQQVTTQSSLNTYMAASAVDSVNQANRLNSQAAPEGCANQAPTSHTPCPFLNMLIHNKKISCEQATVDELVQAGKEYGIDESLMKTLASARVEKGTSTVIIPKLLDPSLFPAHRGSLARNDEGMEALASEKLHEFETNPEFSTNGTVSYKQLEAFQQYCWQKSDMRVRDKLPATAELDLLWSLFGAYKSKPQTAKGSETIPLSMVRDFIKENKLPADFVVNKQSPATFGRLVANAVYQLVARGLGFKK